jgi:hypothetical protein
VVGGIDPPWVGAAVTGATAVEPTTGSGFFADLRQRRACIAACREQPDRRSDQPLTGLRPSFGLVPAARPECLSVTGVARELSDADFRADVVGDACTTTGGPSIHAAALTILAGLFSSVITMDRMFSAA